MGKIQSKYTIAKMLEGITEKGLHVQYADEFLSGINPQQVKSIQTVYQKFGRSGIQYWVKEAYSSLTDDEADSVASEVVRRVTGRATSDWRGESGDYTDMLAQISQPKGGSEMLVNLHSPGMGPAKTTAEPGNSGDYGRKAEPISDKYPQAYRNPTSAGRVYPRDPNAKNPEARIGEGQVAQDQYGPVGTPGSYGQFPDEVSQGVLIPGTQGRVARFRYKSTATNRNKPPSTIKKGPSSSYNFDYTGPHILGWTQPVMGDRSPVPKFAIMPQAFGQDPRLSDGRGINRPQRAEKITKGLIRHEEESFVSGPTNTKHEDNRVRLAGTREGDVIAHGQRQQAYHTEEDTEDVGDNSEYASNPYGDDQASEDEIFGLFEEAKNRPMTKLEEEEEGRRGADEEEAKRLDDMARYDEEEATKAYREGRYEAVNYLRAKAMAERETATNFRKRSRTAKKALTW